MLPGNFVLHIILEIYNDFSNYLGLGPQHDTGVLTFIISAIVWLGLFRLLLLIKEPLFKLATIDAWGEKPLLSSKAEKEE